MEDKPTTRYYTGPLFTVQYRCNKCRHRKAKIQHSNGLAPKCECPDRPRMVEA